MRGGLHPFYINLLNGYQTKSPALAGLLFFVNAVGLMEFPFFCYNQT